MNIEHSVDAVIIQSVNYRFERTLLSVVHNGGSFM